MAARVSCWLSGLQSYSSIQILDWFVFPLLVSKMALPPHIRSVTLSVNTGYLYTFTAFYCQTSIPEQACVYYTVDIQTEVSKTCSGMGKVLSAVSLFLLIFAENPGIYLYVALNEHFLMLREAAVLHPSYLRRVRNVLLLGILRGIQHAPALLLGRDFQNF